MKKIQGFRFGVNINGHDHGFSTVTTVGDNIEMVKDEIWLDHVLNSLHQEDGTIKITVNLGLSSNERFDGIFSDYEVHDYKPAEGPVPPLHKITLKGVKISGDPVFDLDAMRSFE